MNLIMVTEKMDKYNFERKLFKLLEGIDQDFVGENGEEYLLDEAKEKGFNSNLEYSISKAKEKYCDIKEVISSVIYDAINGWDNYYEYSEYSVVEIHGEYVVTIAVIDNN